MDVSIDLTDSQILRQINKLRCLVFEDFKENENGTYEGEITDGVAEIIEDLTNPLQEMTEKEFLELISKGTKALIKFFEGEVNSINDDIIHFFAFDFITQTLDNMYGRVLQNKVNYFDPMFI
jgi:hypothetical protein